MGKRIKSEGKTIIRCLVILKDQRRETKGKSRGKEEDEGHSDKRKHIEIKHLNIVVDTSGKEEHYICISFVHLTFVTSPLINQILEVF
jgi:hypothetical protein